MMRRPWSASLLGRLLRVHSPSEELRGRCWCQERDTAESVLPDPQGVADRRAAIDRVIEENRAARQQEMRDTVAAAREWARSVDEEERRMEPMTTEALQERIAEAFCEPAHRSRWPLALVDSYCGQCWGRSAAVLPIIRKAQADAPPTTPSVGVVRQDGCMSVSPNFSIVTLGVANLERSIAFYRDLGWEQRGNPTTGITWFRTSGTWIGLFGYTELAADVGVPADPPTTYRGITLALNFNSEADVNTALAEAVHAGARLVKPAERADWGGYSGYFADPDGHLWEAACAPVFPVADDGTIDIRD